jgi:hypothetical protein
VGLGGVEFGAEGSDDDIMGGIGLAVALLEGKFIGDGGAAGGKDGKLTLRHGRRVNDLPPCCQAGFIGFPGNLLICQ